MSNNLNKRIKELKRLREEISVYSCEHPLWYFWGEKDNTWGKVWTCQCLKCGVFKIDRSKRFDGKVILKKDNNGFNKKIDDKFETVEKDYCHLEEENYGIDKIKKILLTKYNEE